MVQEHEIKAPPVRPHAISASRRLRTALMAALLLLSGTVSYAQEFGIEPNRPESTEPDLEDGKKLANKLCIGCHLIDKAAAGPTQADVPSFPNVANRPGQSFETLVNWLMAPHAPMPDPHLTRTEIRDLAGYIFSLRNAD
jgi:cytochrome c